MPTPHLALPPAAIPAISKQRTENESAEAQSSAANGSDHLIVGGEGDLDIDTGLDGHGGLRG